ncbi:hypothetical protein H9P43_005107 [Blastocladiella emersonii ATCC 22665]|nr:hypothetical protein H9P43_005107 [Blastocladiella emersonii ATCC 22665]
MSSAQPEGALNVILACAGVLGVVLLMYLVKRWLDTRAHSAKSATEPFRQDAEAPPVPPVPRHIMRSSSAIISTHATHAAIEAMERASAANARASTPALRSAHLRGNPNAPPEPTLVRKEDRELTLKKAAERVIAEKRAAAEAAAAAAKGKSAAAAAKKRRSSGSVNFHAIGIPMTGNALDVQDMTNRHNERVKAHQERVERRAAAKAARDAAEAAERKEKAMAPVTPTLVREPPPRAEWASLLPSVVESVLQSRAEHHHGGFPGAPAGPGTPLSETGSSVISVDSAMHLTASAVASLSPIAEEPRSPAALESPTEPEFAVKITNPTPPLSRHHSLDESAFATASGSVTSSGASSPSLTPSASSSALSSSSDVKPPAAIALTRIQSTDSTASFSSTSSAASSSSASRKVPGRIPLSPRHDATAAIPTSPLARSTFTLDNDDASSTTSTAISTAAAPAPAAGSGLSRSTSSVGTRPTPTPPPASAAAARLNRTSRSGAAPRFLERIASSGTIVLPSSLAAKAQDLANRRAAARAAAASGGSPDLDPRETTLVRGAQYLAVAAYLARRDDEVSVMRGDRVTVERMFADAWCLGVNKDLEGMRGVFPRMAVYPLIFSDFDGTISTRDTGTVLIDACMGKARRTALDKQIIKGTRSFRDAVAEMWASVDLTVDAAMELLKDVKLDAAFAPFLEFCDAKAIPVTVLSSGLDMLVKPMLARHLGERAATLRTVVNRGGVSPADGRWTIEYLDDTPHGHDKAASIRSLTQTLTPPGATPLVIFIGDGVSDIPGARASDRLYARRGLDLERYCVANGIAHVAFDSFETILEDLRALVEMH